MYNRCESSIFRIDGKGMGPQSRTLRPSMTVSPTTSCDDSGGELHAAPTWVQRYGLIIVGVSPIAANAIGSVFNILYNQTQIEPQLSSTQMQPVGCGNPA